MRIHSPMWREETAGPPFFSIASPMESLDRGQVLWSQPRLAAVFIACCRVLHGRRELDVSGDRVILRDVVLSQASERWVRRAGLQRRRSPVHMAVA